MASIKGFSLKNVKETVGREGMGLSATMYLNGKKIGTYTDWGDGSMEEVDYLSREDENEMMKVIIAFAKENPNEFIENLYAERPQQYADECDKFRCRYPFFKDEDITIRTMASNSIVYIISALQELLDIEKAFKKGQKKGWIGVYLGADKKYYYFKDECTLLGENPVRMFKCLEDFNV